MENTTGDPYTTRTSIFMRLHANQQATRELAWEEFRARYAPIIAGFARNLGASLQDIDDVVQEVMLGFFKTSPSFVYDPSRGRFRGYLKTCTLHVLRRSRAANRLKFHELPLDQVAPDSTELDELWEKEWQEGLMARAIGELRREQMGSRTLLAFELHVLEKQDADEVARRLGIGRNAVQQAKSRVLSELRDKVRRLAFED